MEQTLKRERENTTFTIIFIILNILFEREENMLIRIIFIILKFHLCLRFVYLISKLSTSVYINLVYLYSFQLCGSTNFIESTRYKITWSINF